MTAHGHVIIDDCTRQHAYICISKRCWLCSSTAVDRQSAKCCCRLFLLSRTVSTTRSQRDYVTSRCNDYFTMFACKICIGFVDKLSVWLACLRQQSAASLGNTWAPIMILYKLYAGYICIVLSLIATKSTWTFCKKYFILNTLLLKTITYYPQNITHAYTWQFSETCVHYVQYTRQIHVSFVWAKH